MENPEDPNKLDKVYLRLTDIERRLNQLDEEHKKLRDDYQFNRGGRRKTRRKKNKKKRHIITRKNKRKRRRRTKKKRKGGTKGKVPPSLTKRVLHRIKKNPKTEAFTKKRRSALKLPSKLRKMTQRPRDRKSVSFMPIQITEENTEEKKDMDVDGELANLFSALPTPTEASRTHNSEKTLASKIVQPKE